MIMRVCMVMSVIVAKRNRNSMPAQNPSAEQIYQQPDEGNHHRFVECHHIFALDKTHLKVKLGEFRLTLTT